MAERGRQSQAANPGAATDAAPRLARGAAAAPGSPAPRAPVSGGSAPGLRRGRPLGLTAGLWAIAGLAVLVIVLLLLVVVRLSFASASGIVGTGAYVAVFGSGFAWRVIWQTLAFGCIATLVAMACGGGVAWLVERSDLPSRTKAWMHVGMTAGLLMPGFALAIGWLFLLDPRIGLINQAWRSLVGSGPLYDVETVAGMGWVQGFSLAPVAFIFMAGLLRNLDATFEEAARAAGASYGTVLRTVVLPTLTPGALASALYIFAITLGVFDIPAILGLSQRVFTLSTYIYQLTQPAGGAPQYNQAAAVGMLTIVLAIGATLLYGRAIRVGSRFQTLGGRGVRANPVRLGRARPVVLLAAGAYYVVAILLPILVVLWVSLLPYAALPSRQALRQLSAAAYVSLPLGLVGRGAVNTALLMVLAPTLALLAGGSVAWLVARSRSRLRWLLDGAAYLPHAVPEIVFAVGAMTLALAVDRWLPLYGTDWLTLVVFAAVDVSFVVRVVTAALLQVAPELEEAGHTSGARLALVLRTVTGPLVAPTLISGWLFLSLLAFRNLTVPALLAARGNVTLSVVVWSLWNGGSAQNSAAAISFLMIMVLSPCLWLYWYLYRRGLRRPGAAAVAGDAAEAGFGLPG